MKTAGLAIAGLIGGFIGGEALAMLIGIPTGALSDTAPPGPILVILRSLPFVVAIAGAVVLPLLVNRLPGRGRRPGKGSTPGV